MNAAVHFLSAGPPPAWEPISRLFSDGRKRRSSKEKLDPSSAAEQQSDQQGEQVDDQELQTEDQAWRSGAGI